MKNLCRSTGGSCKCLQKSTWGEGVQKVQKLVYVVYGWRPRVMKSVGTKNCRFQKWKIVTFVFCVENHRE